jgi:hypothetical protein
MLRHFTRTETRPSGITVRCHYSATPDDLDFDGYDFLSPADELRDAEYTAASVLAEVEERKAQARKDIADARDHQGDRQFVALCLKDASHERLRAMRCIAHAAAIKRGIEHLRAKASAPMLLAAE